MAKRLFTFNPQFIVQAEEGWHAVDDGAIKRTGQPSQKLPARLGQRVLGSPKAILPEEKATLERYCDMTDSPSGRQLVEKTFVYMATLSKECRKALTDKFGKEHKGMPFDSIEPTMRKEIESWFAERDKNITIRHESSNRGRPGEISMSYLCENKDAHFKFYVDGQFTLAGTGANAPTYLKSINVNVDKRDFTK